MPSVSVKSNVSYTSFLACEPDRRPSLNVRDGSPSFEIRHRKEPESRPPAAHDGHPQEPRSTTMSGCLLKSSTRTPWNKGKLIGANLPYDRSTSGRSELG